MAAAQSDSAEVIRALVDAKADVNARDRQGGTALMFAAFAGKPAAVEALIAAKADVNIQTHAGESALRIAKTRKLQDIVAILEKAGAKE
jgi:serine/threonine-protein phosphatase 6 regulatory ankyrin repeat subunit B